MAHFAELKLRRDPTGFTEEDHYVVTRVIVVGNDIPAGNSRLEHHDMHIDGEHYCRENFGGEHWKQTSYNAKFRHRYAGNGMVYDPTHDVFRYAQPFASWTYNDTLHQWDAPVAFPSTKTYIDEDGDERTYLPIEWSEANQKWIGYRSAPDGESNPQYEWNPSTSAWDATGG